MARYIRYQNNNRMSKAYGKYYLKPVVSGETSTEELAEIIQRNCTAKYSDVLAVLKELSEVMTDQLGAGMRIRLNGLGTFQLRTQYANGALTADEATPLNFSRTSVLFKPEQKRNGKSYFKPLLAKLKWKEQDDYVSPANQDPDPEPEP